MKGGIGWNLRISGVKRYIWDIHLMFLSREIDKKLYQNYTKIHIYTILYRNCSIKQIIFNKYETNLKTTIFHKNLRISGLLLLWFYIFNLTFFKDLFNNIMFLFVSRDQSFGHVIRAYLSYCKSNNSSLYES